jgi:triacylglycerol lipase
LIYQLSRQNFFNTTRFLSDVYRLFSVALAPMLVLMVAACATTTPTAPSPQGGAKPAPTQATAAPIKAGTLPPILFVHGNGDTSALWHTTIWRFESNGWPPDRLFAIDFPLPLARTDDTKAQDGRAGSAELLGLLTAEVARIQKLTNSPKVVLIGNSRGGYVIRNYLKNGGQGNVVAAIMGGTPNHGVFISNTFQQNSEFNGAGPFLSALNKPQGPNGSEVTPGVPTLSLRSDGNDKFAQPDGKWIGQPGMNTQIDETGPELKGATNIVLPRRDHRETSFHPDAFAATYRFLTGNAPARTSIVAEASISLNGRVVGYTQGASGELSNLALPGARVSVYEVKPETGERVGPAVLKKTVGVDGVWGPLRGSSTTSYEFVIEADSFATTHIYRSPFPRSSNLVQLRPARLSDADKAAQSVITLTRPRGYLGAGRDQITMDGKPAPGLIPGVAGSSVSKMQLMLKVNQSIVTQFNDERIAVLAWPIAERHLVFAELHY